MDNSYTYIGCVLDRSGSMGAMDKIGEARSGFNAFLEDQKKLDGRADIKVVIFDDSIDELFQGNVNSCPKLTEQNFSPRGMTAYLDALGTTIVSVGAKLDGLNEDEKPSKVIILVITDGLENASREYNGSIIKEMIDTQKNKYNWEFVFMGADEKSIEDAKQFGIVNTVLYADDEVGTRSAYTAMSATVSTYRQTGEVDTSAYETS